MTSNLTGYLLGGIVLGKVVHYECATRDERALTWAAFFTRSTLTREKGALVCERCGNTIEQGKA